jgi:hypothetical protein
MLKTAEDFRAQGESWIGVRPREYTPIGRKSHVCQPRAAGQKSGRQRLQEELTDSPTSSLTKHNDLLICNSQDTTSMQVAYSGKFQALLHSYHKKPKAVYYLYSCISGMKVLFALHSSILQVYKLSYKRLFIKNH